MEAGPLASSEQSLFIPNRLKLLIPPQKAKVFKPRITSLKKYSNVQAVLKTIFNLPFDIILEILSWFSPASLLTFARLSKDLRAFLMSQSSRSIWRIMLSRQSGLPPCPRDLTEPQYASLMFETFCMACGSTRALTKICFISRLRLCTTCQKTNIGKGREIQIPIRIRYLIDPLTLVPSTNMATRFYEPKAGNYLPWRSYFRPEVEKIVEALGTYGMHPADLQTFIVRQRSDTARMLQEGIAMGTYYNHLLSLAEQAENNIMLCHSQSVIQEMIALGWEEKYFPQPRDGQDHDQWHEYLFQNKEFTAQSWGKNQSWLLTLYISTRRTRRAEFMKEKYLGFRAAQPAEKRRTLPGWGDVYELPLLEVFYSANDADDASADLIIQQIEDASTGFVARVEQDLTAIIKEGLLPNPPKIRKSTRISSKGKGKAKAVVPEVDSASILSKAAHMFLCECNKCGVFRTDRCTVLSYPDIVDHIISGNTFTTKGWDVLKPRTNLWVVQAARDVLAALNLQEECSRDEVLKLGKFSCRCEHYQYQGPLTFEELIDHVYHQQSWYRYMLTHVGSNSPEDIEQLVVDGHSRKNLVELVVAESRGCSPQRFPDAVMARRRSALTIRSNYCQYCYRITGKCCPVMYETSEYHAKYSHGINTKTNILLDQFTLEKLYRAT